MKRTFGIVTVIAGVLLVGCDNDDVPVAGGGGPAAGDARPAETTPGTELPQGQADGEPAAPKELLGTKTAGGYELKAYQTGPIEAGELDLVITGGPGKPKVVRFWVGTESAEGSVKALAEEETPNNWHVHPEVPEPLPPGSQFWAEIEPPDGQKVTASFDLKR